ncbi:MAG: AIR synthase-related protein [bacterium]
MSTYFLAANTGFSLLGHAWGMARASNVGLVFEAGSMPRFSGVEELAAQGYLTKGDRTNREYLGDNIQIDAAVPEDLVRVLYDPQTSGGLLVSISGEDAKDFVARLKKEGVRQAALVGRVVREHQGRIKVR